MLRILLVFLVVSIRTATAQSPVTREQMLETKRVTKEQLEAGYQTQIPGWIIQSGDSLQLGRGSMVDKRFAFVYESLISLSYLNADLTKNPRSNEERHYLASNMSSRRSRIKELFQYGTKRTGYIMIAKVNVGMFTNYWIEIDNAIEAGELLPPSKLRVTTSPVNASSSVGVADELKKLKELLDAGVLTKEEFDSQKQKLLAKP